MGNALPGTVGEPSIYAFHTGEPATCSDAIEHLKQTSTSSSPSIRLRESRYWLGHPALINESEIVIFENETKRYTLVPDQEVLKHDNENPGYSFFTIVWNPEADREETTTIYTYEGNSPEITDPDMSQNRVLSMRSDSSGSLSPCVFVSLGYLREKDLPLPTSRERMPTTYYVVLLNLSTDPVSVWLMFDYHSEDDENDCYFRWTNRLGEYYNHTFSRGRGELLPKLEDRFPPVPTGDVTRFRDFLAQHSNLTGPPQPNEEPSSTDDDAINNVPADKLHKDAKGYFGLPRHDLALIAPDIMSWTPQGFDTQQVYTCLRGTHVHLGSSLRAKTATDEEVQSTQQNRVSFEDLRFR
ncbi:MAG: hypothetical protein Q9208_006803 [Pyrenodesmia sp. 3 TL-2023]